MQVGARVKHLKLGDTVGLGWFSGSCMICQQCLSGNHNLCPDAEQTIVGRHGGFANKVRCQAEWAVPLPAGLDARKAGPLFCAGITVFNALVQFDVKPTQRVGVVGIGGLGHLALQFLDKWGCEVTAFTSTDASATLPGRWARTTSSIHAARRSSKRSPARSTSLFPPSTPTWIGTLTSPRSRPGAASISSASFPRPFRCRRFH